MTNCPNSLSPVERVRAMEELYDLVRAGLNAGLPACHSDLAGAVATLRAYLEEGVWLEDYCRDEQGLFPRELKRGVLSQDGLYDLLGRIDTQRFSEYN